MADDDRRYVAFVRNFEALRAQAGWAGENRAVDRYLWLAGLYREWGTDRQAPINREARALFDEPPAAVAVDLAALMGTDG